MNVEDRAVDIASFDAKDIYLAMHSNKPVPQITLKTIKGELNTGRFINSFDRSLDTAVLRKAYKKVYHKDKFMFPYGTHWYSTSVINLTFRFSVKEFNLTGGHCWMRFGYDRSMVEFQDNVALVDGELVGIILYAQVKQSIPEDQLTKYFKYDPKENVYKEGSTPPTLIGTSDLRHDVYKNGFVCDGIHFVRMKRSSGSARQGKCLFCDEALYPYIHEWDLCGLTVTEGQAIDLAAFESYISLTSSSIIDTMEISAKNILVIDDYDSVFEDIAVPVEDVGGKLVSEPKKTIVKNSIWDGESLIDISLIPDKYKNKGMLLLRNRFFKSAAFNCNIQKWFKDNNITSIKQLNGKTKAKDISDIKLITTPNSIKYLKFGTLDAWLKNLSKTFGIVKYDKPPKFFDGELVQTHYQLINTLEMNREEMADFLHESKLFEIAFRAMPEVFRYYIHYPIAQAIEDRERMRTEDVVFDLMAVSDRFCETRLYGALVREQAHAYRNMIQLGKVLVNGNYSVLCGNPIEMLQSAIGKFIGEPIMDTDAVYSTRFPFGSRLLASRSPHPAMGNVLLLDNKNNALIKQYINVTPQIAVINSIGTNILNRLSGADFDSDTFLLTDNQHLVRAAEKNYDKFLVPTYQVAASKIQRYYTAEQMADLDVKTSVNKIGEIINLAQILNSVYWDQLHHGKTHEQLQSLYLDICTLDIMSNIEIDSAKKEFAVNNGAELKALREKYQDILTTEDGKKIKPYFFKPVNKSQGPGQDGYYDPHTKEYYKFDTAMDHLEEEVESWKHKIRKRRNGKDQNKPLSYLVEPHSDPKKVNQYQIKQIIGTIRDYDAFRKANKFRLDEQALWYDSQYERKMRMHMYWEDYVAKLNEFKITPHTFHRLLNMLDEKEYSDIRRMLFSFLFRQTNQFVYESLVEAKEPIGTLELNTSGSIVLFGKRLLVKYKKIDKEYIRSIFRECGRIA